MAATKFWPIVSVLQAPIYNLTKSLVPVLNILTKNKYTLRNSYQFAEGDLISRPAPIKSSLGVNSLFINTNLDETLDICINHLLEHTDTVESFAKEELK